MNPKVFLRLKETDLYYAQIGGWTPKVERAMDFKEVTAAEMFTERQGLKNVEIVMRTEHGDALVTV